MADFGDYKNNPLWTDITHLQHLSPQPGFNYQWNRESGRWEPDQSNLYLHGVSGLISDSNIWLRGISGVLTNEIKIGVDLDHDTEAHRILLGISGVLETTSQTESSDKETHRLLSGVSGILEAQEKSSTESNAFNISGSRAQNQQWKLRTKTVNQKIEEDFILLESVPDDIRLGTSSGTCYGSDRSLMDDIYGTYFSNSRTNPSTPETGHPDYFMHPEYIDPDRCVEAVGVFHTDTAFGMRQENSGASDINSYALEDYNDLYDRGLAESITIFNESPYPLQFHTADRRYHHTDSLTTETNDLIYLDSDVAVTIKNDEAGRVYVKRPHTISGYTVKYALSYKVTGTSDTIL